MLLLILIIVLIFSIGFTAFVFFYGKDEEEDVEVFEEVRNPQILQILVPRENEKTPLAAEQMFASIHGILRDSKKSLDMLSFEFSSNFDQGIRFFVVTPHHLVKFIEGQVYAQYPNAEIKAVNDYTQNESPAYLSDGTPYQSYITTGEIELSKEFIFPVKTFRSFEVDPLAAIIGAMSDLREGEEAWLQVLMRPVANYWQDTSKEYITAIKDGREPGKQDNLLLQFLSDMGNTISTINLSGGEDEKKGGTKETVTLAPGQSEELAQIEEKMLKPGFEIAIRVVTKAQDQFLSEQLLRDIVASFKQFTTSHLNSFVHSEPDENGEVIYSQYINRHLDADSGDIINIEELASLYHLPNNSVETPNIMWSRARKAEPPLDLPVFGTDEEITPFGETDYRGQRITFGLKRHDRRRHMYLLGKTGVGKSSTFKTMFISDVMRGDGACFIDPHGQDIEELLNYIPPNRVNDIVYFDPSDSNNPVGFNLLELDDLSQRDLVADAVVSVFKKEFGDSWGPRLQYLLQNAVATCLEAQGTTILAVQRILIDTNYRKFILKQVNDPILLKFWEEEYAQMAQNSRLITEAVAPIQNKIGRFISSAIIRNIVGQVKSTIRLRDIMDDGKILMVNLAQGKIGEESASLLGGMLITRLQSAAMERVDIPEDERRDFFLFVDEFQNFATDSFAKILSEARKFRLNLVLTNQYIEQVPLTVRHSIFGNVGTLASFVVSQNDASILAQEMAPIFTAEDLVSLESHSIYVKLCIDGMTSKPFSAKSINYKDHLHLYNLRDEIRASSREKYGMDKSEIEGKILKWSKQSYSEKGNRSNMNSGLDLSSSDNRDKNYDNKNKNKKRKTFPNKNSQNFEKTKPIAQTQPVVQTQPVLEEQPVVQAQQEFQEQSVVQAQQVTYEQPVIQGQEMVQQEQIIPQQQYQDNQVYQDPYQQQEILQPDPTYVDPQASLIEGQTYTGYAEVDYENPVISADQQVHDDQLNTPQS
jgi:hypothetical protein